LGIDKRVLVVLSVASGFALIASAAFAKLGPDEIPVPKNPISSLECDSGVTHDFFEVWGPSSIETHNDSPVKAVANYLRTAPAFEDPSEHAQEFRPAPERRSGLPRHAKRPTET
jgi:hypothetical protein